MRFPDRPAGDSLLDIAGAVKRRDGADRAFALAVPRLTLHRGRAMAFVGPSGSGKSTLIDLLAMTLKPDTTRRFVFCDPHDGQSTDLMGLWQAGAMDALARLRSRHFGYVLQTGGLLPFLSVYENIALPQRLLGFHRAEVIRDLARRLDIAETLGAMPSKLSVGQRQRVAIARALAHQPTIVLADEPTASLDPMNAVIVMDLFMELIDKVHATLVIATHDGTLVQRYGLPIVAAEVRRRGNTVETTFGDSLAMPAHGAV
ncbi:MAG: ATP-binding cassette domain-containing protein [Rhodospirillaceae bacterium]|nr:ATP-binding cassette domain-containing protein [Rhodospirillaceae bacterium]